MTDKEIYKARAEGFRMIEENHKIVSDSNFLEFMSYIKEIVEQYEPSKKVIEERLKEKCEDRIKLVQLFRK